MTRPTVTHTKLRGPSGDATRYRRQVIRERVNEIASSIATQLSGCDDDLRSRINRGLTRALSRDTMDRVGQQQAAGDLIRALTDIAPAWRDDPRLLSPEDEAVFSGASERA